MAEVHNKPESHFLDLVKKMGIPSAPDVVVIRYGLSKLLNRETIVNDIANIAPYLAAQKDRANKVYEAVLQQVKDVQGAHVYFFTDNDIIVAIPFKGKKGLEDLRGIHQKIACCLPTGISEFLILKDHFHYCIKIAHDRQAHMSLMATYAEMGSVEKIKWHQSLRADRQRPLVMIADSSLESAQFIRKLIAEEYDIFVVDSGYDAVKEYIWRAPDCVVLDLNTPGFSGIEVSTCIKAIDIRAFIVMMSTDAIQQKIVDAFNSGAGDFIKKPFPKARLVKAISKSYYIEGEQSSSLEEMQKSEEVFLF